VGDSQEEYDRGHEVLATACVGGFNVETAHRQGADGPQGVAVNAAANRLANSSMEASSCARDR
jgi:hypothetical protein